jgi:transcription elongation factor Elf1
MSREPFQYEMFANNLPFTCWKCGEHLVLGKRVYSHQFDEVTIYCNNCESSTTKSLFKLNPENRKLFHKEMEAFMGRRVDKKRASSGE